LLPEPDEGDPAARDGSEIPRAFSGAAERDIGFEPTTFSAGVVRFHHRKARMNELLFA
jgi:hypothetical protein